MTSPAVKWNAASLQVSLFTKSPTPKSIDIYSALAGAPADSREDRTKEAVVRQTGTIGNNLLQVGFNPIRVDVVLSPSPPEPSLGAGDIRLSMGRFKDEMDSFSDMVRTWLGVAELPVTRISLICAAVTETGSREEAYNVLARYLKSVQVTPEMEELIFRVNWKSKTNLLPEGYLNRISAWSAVKLAISAGTAANTNMTTISETNFARMDLDINTPHDRTEIIPPNQIVPIFDQLVKLAKENVEKGERP
jgi:hypothetical protein